MLYRHTALLDARHVFSLDYLASMYVKDIAKAKDARNKILYSMRPYETSLYNKHKDVIHKLIAKYKELEKHGKTI